MVRRRRRCRPAASPASPWSPSAAATACSPTSSGRCSRRPGPAGRWSRTLYPTAPGIYRRLGYELVGALDFVELPTSELLGVRAPAAAGPGRVTTRRAAPGRRRGGPPRLRPLGGRPARSADPPRPRRSRQTDEELFADLTGLTLAVADGYVDGPGRRGARLRRLATRRRVRRDVDARGRRPARDPARTPTARCGG